MIKGFFTALVCILFLSLPAFSAGVPDTFGFGVRAMSLGGAFTAVADDYSAALYNPAGLARRTGNSATIEYLYASPDIEVEKTNGEDLILYSPNHQVRNDPTEYPGGSGLNLQIPIIGLVIDINDILNLPCNVQLGLATSLSENNDVLYRIHNFPPDQPHFFRYGNDISRLHLTVGLGVEVVPGLLYLGGGIKSLLYGDSRIYVDGLTPSDDPESEQVVGQVKQAAILDHAPVAGIMFTPFNRKLSIGLSFREEQVVDIDPLANLIELDIAETSLNIPLVLGMYSFFTPRQYSFGIAYSFEKFMVSLEADFQQWSEYDYPEGEQLFYASDNPALADGTESGSPDFDDTINCRLGIEFKPGKNLSIMLGYCYQPTPIPDQSGRISNYLDMDKDIFSIGGSYMIAIPFWLHQPLTVAGVFQYQLLHDYSVDKDGVKGISWENQESYRVSGNVYTGGVSLRFAW